MIKLDLTYIVFFYKINIQTRSMVSICDLNKTSKEIYITFEIGPTHTGFESCIEYCKKVKKSGADAIKIQMMDAERLIADKKQIFEYKILSKNKKKIINKKESLYKILKRRELTKKQIEKIKFFCDKINLEFISTVFFEEDIDFLKNLGCNSIKIASADINYEKLLIKAAKSKLNIQLDTGMSTLKEINKSISILKKHNNKNFLIHHCPSGYPANVEKINLNMINEIKSRFGCPVGFSDHSPDWEMSVAAVALGANLIEKTITFDRCYPSVEHIMSIELNKLEEFVKKINFTKKAIGKRDLILTFKEIKNRNYLRRSAYFIRNELKGTKIKDCKIDFKRPGLGIDARDIENIKNKKLLKNVKKYQILNKKLI